MQSAICLSKNPQFHGCSKYIDIRYHFIRDETKKRNHPSGNCKTEDMVVDTMMLILLIPYLRYCNM